MSFKHELQIEEITVLQRKGYADRICILIRGQSPLPTYSELKPTLTLDVANGYGVDFVRNNFGYVPKVISLD